MGYLFSSMVGLKKQDFWQKQNVLKEIIFCNGMNGKVQKSGFQSRFTSLQAQTL